MICIVLFKDLDYFFGDEVNLSIIFYCGLKIEERWKLIG